MTEKSVDFHPETTVSEDVEEGATPKSATIGYERQMSKSERASFESTQAPPPKWLVWFETPFRVKTPSNGIILPEGTAWAMDGSARAPLNQAGALVGATLLRLAFAETSCTNPATCTEQVYGFKPSSLLTFFSTIGGVMAALFMPVFGAIIDHTRYRKHVGVVSAALVSIITGVQLMVNEDTWFAVLVLEAVGAFTLVVHATAVFAYLPDLTEKESDMVHYTSRFNIRQYALQTVYVAMLVIIGEIRGQDRSLDSAIRSGREALGIAFGLAVPLFAYSWTFLFRKRDALSQVPEGTSLLTCGFVQVYRTFKKINRKYTALKWLLFSMLFSFEAGAGVGIAIAVSFLVTFLQMTSQDVAKLSLVLLIANVPGSIFAKWVALKVNPLNSMRGGMFFFAASVAVACAVLDGPDVKDWSYLFAAVWGFCVGWIYPSQKVLFVMMIPKGQETEMMGLFTFAGQIFGWVPPLIFTTMNENGIDMRWGFSLLSWFTAAGLFVTLFIGSYEDAVAQVQPENDVDTKKAVKELENPQESPLDGGDPDTKSVSSFGSGAEHES